MDVATHRTTQLAQTGVQVTYRRGHQVAMVAGVLVLALLVGMAKQGVPLVALQAQLLLFVLAFGLLVWGLGAGSTMGVYGRRLWRWLQTREAQALLLLTMVALALRVVQLDTSVRYLIDEMNTLSGALSANNTPQQALLDILSWNIMPYPHHYTAAHGMAINVFGHGFFGLRVLDAVIGALCVPLVYGLGRVLFNPRAGWLAALVLMTFPFHLHFSRLALINLTDAILLTAIFLFLALMWQHNRRMDAVLAGACIGLTAYFYEGARLLVVPVVGVWLLYCGMIQGRMVWRNVGWMLATAAIIALPFYGVWFTSDTPVVGRMATTSIDLDYWLHLLFSPLAPVADSALERLITPFALYIALPDDSPFYGAQTAMIQPYLVPFFLLGVGMALTRWRTWALLPVWWITAYALANSLVMSDYTLYSRYIGAVPALALLIAVGMDGIWRALAVSQRRQAVRRVAYAGVAVLVGAQAIFYFGHYLPHYNAQLRLNEPLPDMQDVVLRAAQLPDDVYVHVIVPHNGPLHVSTQTYMAIFAQFILGERPITFISTSELSDTYLHQQAHNADHAFFIWRLDSETPQRIDRIRPLTMTPVMTPYDDIPVERQFVLYHTRSADS